MNGSVPLEQIKDDIAARDLRDSTRESAPLAKAHDAIEVDTTQNSPEEIVQMLLG